MFGEDYEPGSEYDEDNSDDNSSEEQFQKASEDESELSESEDSQPEAKNLVAKPTSKKPKDQTEIPKDIVMVIQGTQYKIPIVDKSDKNSKLGCVRRATRTVKVDDTETIQKFVDGDEATILEVTELIMQDPDLVVKCFDIVHAVPADKPKSKGYFWTITLDDGSEKPVRRMMPVRLYKSLKSKVVAKGTTKTSALGELLPNSSNKLEIDPRKSNFIQLSCPIDTGVAEAKPASSQPASKKRPVDDDAAEAADCDKSIKKRAAPSQATLHEFSKKPADDAAGVVPPKDAKKDEEEEKDRAPTNDGTVALQRGRTNTYKRSALKDGPSKPPPSVALERVMCKGTSVSYEVNWDVTPDAKELVFKIPAGIETPKNAKGVVTLVF
jgi:hypothetical protein